MESSNLHYVVPFRAAAIAIIPTYYGFVAKSARQVGKPIPQMSFVQAIVQRVRVTPTITSIVGTQMIAQRMIESPMQKHFCRQENHYATMLYSSIAVGCIRALVSQMMQKTYGDNKMIVFASAFFSGSFCSIIGHGTDTKLTCDQAGIKRLSSSYYFTRGGLIKVITMVFFNSIYQTTKKMIESASE